MVPDNLGWVHSTQPVLGHGWAWGQINKHTTRPGGLSHNSRGQEVLQTFYPDNEDDITHSQAVVAALENDDNVLPCRNTGIGLIGAGRQQAALVLGDLDVANRQKQQPPAALGYQNPDCNGESKFSIDTVNSEYYRKKKIKSGMYDNHVDDVVMKLKWPHKQQNKRWVPEKLQVEHVVAGKIKIILNTSSILMRSSAD